MCDALFRCFELPTSVHSLNEAPLIGNNTAKNTHTHIQRAPMSTSSNEFTWHVNERAKVCVIQPPHCLHRVHNHMYGSEINKPLTHTIQQIQLHVYRRLVQGSIISRVSDGTSNTAVQRDRCTRERVCVLEIHNNSLGLRRSMHV